ncbi:hypothetical protein CTI12_AA147200 [Artemisia annua]|uniref:Uncharacterized protein n=1 Tax=Artemisia annua TaxID=35608 RepID=A0A2U1PIA0_ARTAN|nr:hypothetical protein CTI12_AA147200 [Artemisia annua]
MVTQNGKLRFFQVITKYKVVKDTANQQENKRKSQEFSAYCLVMESSKEQEILEAAAFHLILLSNPLQQSHIYRKEYDSEDNDSRDRAGSPRGFGVMMKKRKQDHGGEGIENDHENDIDASSTTFTSCSSSCTSSQTVKSGMLMEEEMEDDKRTAPRLRKNRLRSIVDIYSVTRKL